MQPNAKQWLTCGLKRVKSLHASARETSQLYLSPPRAHALVQPQLGLAGQMFDLVVANILRGPLLELAPRLAAYCAPGGALVLSGILQEQVPDIQAEYASRGFKDFEVATEGSWALLTAVKRPASTG